MLKQTVRICTVINNNYRSRYSLCPARVYTFTNTLITLKLTHSNIQLATVIMRNGEETSTIKI